MPGAAHPKVKLAGRDLKPEEVAGLTIRQDVDTPDQCELVLRNLGSPLPSTTITAGDELSVKLGFDGAPEVLFQGEVVGLVTTYDTSGRSTVAVTGFSRLHRLTRGRKSRTFEDMTDQQIASKIAQEAQLGAKVDADPQVRYKHVYQHNQTDLEFLLERASRIGYVLGFSGDKTMEFRRRDLAVDSGITLKLGSVGEQDELQRFAPRLSLATRVSEVHVRGWDPVERKEIVGKAKGLQKTLGKTSGLDEGKDVFGHTLQYEVDDKVTSQEEADARARAILEAAALTTMTGDALAMGNPKLRPGLVITFDLGADERFSGAYYVVGAVHRWQASAGGHEGGYTTALKVKRNALWAAKREPAPGTPGTVAPEERAATRAAAAELGNKAKKKPPAAPSPSTGKPITRIEIESLEFLTDHKLLTDYIADWEDGPPLRPGVATSGPLFPKPEWTTGAQHPVSHTMDALVSVKLKLRVEPSDAAPETGVLKGVGPDGLVFTVKGIEFRPGMPEVVLTSNKKLKKKIQELWFEISWSTTGTSVPITPSWTGNEMFVTMDTPTVELGSSSDPKSGITLKRMKNAVRAAGQAASVDPHTLMERLLALFPFFNIGQPLGNPWRLADQAATGADCQTIVRYIDALRKMVGCPGKGEVRVVWAKVRTPTKGEESPLGGTDMGGQFHNEIFPESADPMKANWQARLLDGTEPKGGLNKYEACLRFRYPESGPRAVTKYYAGGVGVRANPDEVIRVFHQMVWVDGDKQVGVIHTYWNRP